MSLCYIDHEMRIGDHQIDDIDHLFGKLPKRNRWILISFLMRRWNLMGLHNWYYFHHDVKALWAYQANFFHKDSDWGQRNIPLSKLLAVPNQTFAEMPNFERQGNISTKPRKYINEAEEIYQLNTAKKRKAHSSRKAVVRTFGAVQGGNVAIVTYKKQTNMQFGITLFPRTDQQGLVCTKTERQKTSFFWSFLNGQEFQ